MSADTRIRRFFIFADSRFVISGFENSRVAISAFEFIFPAVNDYIQAPVMTAKLAAMPTGLSEVDQMRRLNVHSYRVVRGIRGGGQGETRRQQ